MKLIHSFKTLNKDTKFYNLIWCTALSCLYAKESGFNIKLYTDSIAYEYLKYLPYDEIEVSLDDLSIVKSIYANSKYEALKNEPLDSIHIDCDVFIKSKNFKNELNFENNDLIVQSLEQYIVLDNTLRNTLLDFWQSAIDNVIPYYKPDWVKDYPDKMYNCGIIGFNNQELKNEFIKQYEEGIKILNTHNDKIKGNLLIDVVVEQQYLYDLCKFKNYKVKKVFDLKDLQQEAIIKGYQHLIGDSKNKYITKIKQLVYKKDWNLYNTLNNLINKNGRY